MKTQSQSTRRTKWQSLIEEQEKSGLSQKEFCSARSIVLSQFVYYRSVFKTRKSDEAKIDSSFSPVQIKAKDILSQTEVKIILPNGFQCFVPSQIASYHLKSLMEALLSC